MAILEKSANSKIKNGEVSDSKKKRKRNKNKKNSEEEESDFAGQQVNGSDKERGIAMKEKKKKNKKSKEDKMETIENKEEEEGDEGSDIEEKDMEKKVKSGGQSEILSCEASFTALPLSEPTMRAISDMGFQHMTQVNFRNFSFI